MRAVPTGRVYDLAGTVDKQSLRSPGNTVNGVTPAGVVKEWYIQLANVSGSYGIAGEGAGIYADWYLDAEL